MWRASSAGSSVRKSRLSMGVMVCEMKRSSAGEQSWRIDTRYCLREAGLPLKLEKSEW
jgi:hypothetical protein